MRAWEREQGDATPYVFRSLRGGPMTRRTVDHVLTEAAKAAGVEFPVHPHMLRHATGFYLANAGLDTRAIQLYLMRRLRCGTSGFVPVIAHSPQQRGCSILTRNCELVMALALEYRIGRRHRDQSARGTAGSKATLLLLVVMSPRFQRLRPFQELDSRNYESKNSQRFE